MAQNIGPHGLGERISGALLLRARLLVLLAGPEHDGMLVLRAVAYKQEDHTHDDYRNARHVAETGFIADAVQPFPHKDAANGAAESADPHGNAQQRRIQLAEPAVDQCAGCGGGTGCGKHPHKNGAHIEHGNIAGKRIDGDSQRALDLLFEPEQSQRLHKG